MSGGDGVIHLASLYALPSILALATKVLIFWIARYTLRDIRPWFRAFLFFLCGVNIAELAGFTYLTRPEQALPCLMAYYFFALGACISLLGLSLDISGQMTPTLNRCLIGYGAAAALALFIPGFTLVGVESIGYHLTRVPGPYYWILPVTILGALFASLAVLARCYATNTNTFRKRRALVMLIGNIPMVLMVALVITAMQLGYKINAAVLVSFFINFLLMVLVYTEASERLFNFLAAIPATREHAAVKGGHSLLFGRRPVMLRESQARFEREMIEEALESCDGNQSRAAEMLGISQDLLLRKLKG